METMHCNRCNKTKPITDFPVRKTLEDGTKIYRTPCKKCKSIPKKTTKIQIIKNKVSSDYKEPKKETTIEEEDTNILTEEETNILKKFAKTLIIADNSIKKNRKATMFSIEENLSTALNKYVEATGLSRSDVVNSILYDFLINKKDSK